MAARSFTATDEGRLWLETKLVGITKKIVRHLQRSIRTKQRGASVPVKNETVDAEHTLRKCDSVGHDRASWRVDRFRRSPVVHGHRSGREQKVRRWVVGGVAARVAGSSTGGDLDTVRECRHGGAVVGQDGRD
ncbi:hypothetical protein NL676_002715 [Syzygium grande]|nr:hypothetical protein NL676_002715 [Syzygium grande]